MGMKIIDIQDFQKFSTADYFSIKQCAYDFLGEYRKDKMVQYAMNVLGYKGDEPEYKLFASTVLFPIDGEFCELYNQSERQLSKFLESLPTNSSDLDSKSTLGRFFRKMPKLDSNILEIKAYEVNHYQLDLALEQGILNIPPTPLDEKEENVKKTA